MRNIKTLDNASLNAVKSALDGFQRFEHNAPEAAMYFRHILTHLIDYTADIDAWNVREQINQEQVRRMKPMPAKVVSVVEYNRIETLTPQERTVLRLVGEGHTNQEMADILGIAYRTLANHKAHLTEKLGLGTAKQLQKYAYANVTSLTTLTGH